MRLYTLLKKACQIIGSLGYDNRVNVTCTRNSTYVPSTSTAECYYIKGERRVYFRCRIAPRSSITFPADTGITVYTISAVCAPIYSTALSVYTDSVTPLDAVAQYDSGAIILRAKGDGVSASREIMISGSWRC